MTQAAIIHTADRTLPVIIESAYELGGKLMAEVTAPAPVFVTEGRHPGRPTAYGLVQVQELEPIIEKTPELTEAIEAWAQALKDLDQACSYDAPSIVAAAQQQVDDAAACVHGIMIQEGLIK